LKKKLIILIIISFIFLNILILPFDISSNANIMNNKEEKILTSKLSKNSRSGGFDWEQIEVISEPIFGQNNNYNFTQEPSIAIEDENIYVVWYGTSNFSNAGTDNDIFFRHYNGSNWSKIQVISEPIQGQNLNFEDSWSPDIAVEKGKIYIVWSDENNFKGVGNDSDIFYRCNLTGDKWENIQVISEPVKDNNFNNEYSGAPSIAVENGKIYLVWDDDSNTIGSGTDRDIFYRCNLTGDKWEDIQVISEPITGENFNIEISAHPTIAIENNKIYIVWGDANNTNNASSIYHDWDIFYRCNITGTSWQDIQVISEPIFGKDINSLRSSFPDISVENNQIYIVWEDLTNINNSGTDRDIFYRCNLNGFYWESIQIISEPSQNNNYNIGHSNNPSIAVENNRIYVIWEDQNDTNGAEGGIFYKCNFTGFYWEPVQVISEPVESSNFNIGNNMWPDLVLNLGKSHVVWIGENDTNGAGWGDDIFYRCIKDPSPLFLNQPNLSPTIGNTSTIFNFNITYFNYNNVAPIKIIVNISGTEYPIIELDQADINYVDGKDYFFNIKNLGIGNHKNQFYATDGKYTWSTRIVNKPIVYNTPPRIVIEDNLTAFEDLCYEVDYEYEDIDVENVGQLIILNFSTNARWLTFDKSTAILNGTPTNEDVGEYWVNVSIYDGIDADFTNFTLTVLNVNDPPIITTNDIEIIYEDEFYEVIYKANDIDTPQDKLDWYMTTNATWLDFNNLTNRLFGTPDNNNVGNFWINVSVNDGEYFDFTNFTLKVINLNDPPRIIRTTITNAIEDELFHFQFEAKDIDNSQNELLWLIRTDADWLAIDNGRAIVNGIPLNEDVGEYWINISITDGEFYDYSNLTLTVENTNDPPEIITKDVINAIVGDLYSINYEAEDIDPIPTTFIWSLQSNTSDWLSIDPITGWLTGIPTENDAGTFWVNISVTDSESGWDHHYFILNVLKSPIYRNNAPKLSNTTMTPSEGNIKTSFTFSIHYYDADGDAPKIIQVVIDDIPRNLKLGTGENASNGVYYYNSTLSEGIQTYYFTASDGLETVRTEDFTTSEIKKLEEASKGKTSWYWLIWIIIVVVIIIILIFVYAYKKYKEAKIPVVKAELIKVVPKHMALPGELSDDEMTEPLMTQNIISEQLPASTPMETKYQLPKATLSKAQRLELLEERFLRGEVDLETYKEIKTKIEAQNGKDISIDDLEEHTTIIDQQLIPTTEPKTEEGIPNSPIEPNQETLLLQTESIEISVPQSEQSTQELPPTSEPKHEAQQSQVTQQQSSIQVRQTKPTIEEETDEE
jgi:hypothetical protein